MKSCLTDSIEILCGDSQKNAFCVLPSFVWKWKRDCIMSRLFQLYFAIFCHLKDSMLQIMSEYFSYWTFISIQQSKYYLWSMNILITVLLVLWASWHCIIAEKWNHVEDLSEQNTGNDESQVMKQELKKNNCVSFCLIEEMLIHIAVYVVTPIQMYRYSNIL